MTVCDLLFLILVCGDRAASNGARFARKHWHQLVYWLVCCLMTSVVVSVVHRLNQSLISSNGRRSNVLLLDDDRVVNISIRIHFFFFYLFLFFLFFYYFLDRLSTFFGCTSGSSCFTTQFARFANQIVQSYSSSPPSTMLPFALFRRRFSSTRQRAAHSHSAAKMVP
eukprot:TRINITY_DN2447_c0_g1_i1.p1 TRINITY_DN2447_c0_g1~~TRINITY_DN2447_c0_g1_i1.p1  ORF type:complete len:167 (-),score=15.21 TRINITY_DN2447_c0_g1_i1:107-607(-)